MVGKTEGWLREVAVSLREFAEESIVNAAIVGTGVLAIVLTWIAQGFGGHPAWIFENAELIRLGGTTAVVIGVFAAYHSLRREKHALAEKVDLYERGELVLDGPIELKDELTAWSTAPGQYEVRGFLAVTADTEALRCMTIVSTAPQLLRTMATLHGGEEYSGWVGGRLRQESAAMVFKAPRLGEGNLIHFLAIAEREFSTTRIALGPQTEPTREEEMTSFLDEIAAKGESAE